MVDVRRGVSPGSRDPTDMHQGDADDSDIHPQSLISFLIQPPPPMVLWVSLTEGRGVGRGEGVEAMGTN